MSERTVQTVECELCGESFDPTDAGGWCTNPECGEWKYAGAEIADASTGDATAERDAASEEGETTTDEQSETGPDAAGDRNDAVATEDPGDDEGAGDEDSADADASTASAGPGTDGPQTTDTADEPDLSDAEEGESDADTAEAVPADTDGTGSADAESGAGEPDDAADAADETVVECVDCGAEVERDANFCPTCGGEVVERTVSEEGDELTECPGCGNDVEPDDNFCAACGEDLEAHRTSEELTECPECSADVDDDDAFCAQCGEDLDAHRNGPADHSGASDSAAGGAAPAAASDETDGGDASEAAPATDEPSASAPETLSLTAYGRSIEVEDGDAVGREIRSLLAEAGRPEDEAVRIHREHVRFVREDGQFYLVDLGDNPTAVEGTPLTKGDREPIAPGDEFTLSEVVTLSVESPDA